MPTSRTLLARLGAVALIVSAILPAAPAPAAADGTPKIAYSSFQDSSYPQIWLANPDGSGAVRLTSAGGGSDGAVLSRDGTRLVYESPRWGYAMLFIIDSNGMNEHRLLPTSFYSQSGTWSPDGSQLAFTHSSNNGQPGGLGSIWVADVATGANLRQLSPAGVDDWLPSWSPDGTWIVFQSDVGGEYQLFLMRPDGTDRRQITTGPGGKTGPRWSPDGTRIAYALYLPALSAASIHILDLDGAGDSAVTDTTGYNGRPAWSPDGAELTFHSNRNGYFHVYRINVDGTNLRQVTSGTTAPGDWNGDWGFVTTPASAGGGTGDMGLDLRVQSPAHADSRIRFATATADEATIEIFDSAGRLVRTLLQGPSEPGPRTVFWDGRDNAGRQVSNGIYHCRLVSGQTIRTAKLAFVR
jgi:Tol biopolymer transport system component